MTNDPLSVGGPHLAAAFFCEHILVEKDDTLSAIRLIDQVTVQVSGETPANQNRDIPVSIVAFILFKSGAVTGKRTLTFRIDRRLPGTPTAYNQELDLVGEEKGSGLLLNLNLRVQESGVYWHDVLLDDQLITRMPLRITIERASEGLA